MNDWLRDLFRDRPAWLNAMMVFCAFMTFVYLPWDFFIKPVESDQEVWFGIMFTGWAAKVMELPHWFIYAAGIHGFRRRRHWMCTWGPLYLAQIALGMLVWNVMQWGSWMGWGLGLIGAAPFLLLAFALADAWEHFSDARPSLRDRYGEWALITGASSGIGAEFARALARQGVSCVLTARRDERLRELANELERDHGIVTRIVCVDLAEADGPDRLAQACRDLELGILINNAGLGYAGPFARQDADRLRGLVAVNCVAPVVLTSHLLGPMCERGRGAVVITGSVAGRQPLPLHGAYSASKAFDLFLGESLYVELRGSGVDVLVVEPGSTKTEFQEVAEELPHDGVSPSVVVEGALRALGRQPYVIVGWYDWMRANLAARVAPRSLVSYMGRDYMRARIPFEKQ